MKNLFKHLIPFLLFSLIACPAFASMQESGAGNISTRDEFIVSSDTELSSHTPYPTGTSWTEETNTTAASVLEAIAANDNIKVDTSEDNDQIVYSMAPAPVQANYGFSLKVVTADSGADNFAYVGCRNVAGSENGYWFGGTANAGAMVLGKNVSGTWTLLDADLIRTLSDGDRLEIRCDGTTISGWINGVLSVIATDSSHTAIGKSAIGCGDLDTTSDDCSNVWVFDDAQVHLIGAGLYDSIWHISNMLVGFECSEGVITKSLNLVSQWDDLTGNGPAINQPTESMRPTFIASDSDFGGNCSIDFTDSNDEMELPTGALNQPVTILMVYKTVGVPGANFGRLIEDNDGSPVMVVQTTGSQISAGSALSFSTTIPTVGVMSGVFNGASSEVFLSGVSKNSGDAGVNAFSSGGFNIGSNGGGIRSCNCRIAAIYIFTKVLNTIEHNIAGNYLDDRFGITWTTIP